MVEMDVARLDSGFTRIVLTGRLDTPAVDRIESRFAASIVAASQSTIVDISRVDFISSMGIRMFITVARSLALRKAKLAIFGAQPMVNQVFEHVALKEVIPIVDSEAEAIAAASVLPA